MREMETPHGENENATCPNGINRISEMQGPSHPLNIKPSSEISQFCKYIIGVFDGNKV